MRVLHLIDTLWLGGAQTVERDYFEMQQENPDLFLFVLRKSDPQLSIRHNQVTVFDSYRRYSLAPLSGIRKLIRDENIEILHCHLLRSQVFGYLLKRFFFPHIKLIIHEQADLIDNAFVSVPFLKLAKRKVNRFITCSEALKKKLIKTVGVEPERITTLYNGINLEVYNRRAIFWNKEEERRKTGIQPGKFVVGFVGRLVKRKGWEEFLGAAKSLLATDSLCFIIAGDGVDREQMLNQITELELSNVIYLGYVSQPNRFYSLLDCLIVPSHHEPMGMIVPEAQAMGVPIIASDVDGMNEINDDGENAIRVKPGNVVELQNAILKVLQQIPFREKLIKGGLENAQKFSINSYSCALDQIYSGIIA